MSLFLLLRPRAFILITLLSQCNECRARSADQPLFHFTAACAAVKRLHCDAVESVRSRKRPPLAHCACGWRRATPLPRIISCPLSTGCGCGPCLLRVDSRNFPSLLHFPCSATRRGRPSMIIGAPRKEPDCDAGSMAHRALSGPADVLGSVSYTHLRAHET